MAAEGFDIKYKDVLDVVNAYKNNLVNLITKLEDMEGAINTFVNNSTFEGESATAIKSYFLDVHGTMVCSLKVTAQNLLDNIALYKASLWEIDSSTNFRLNEEAIGEYRKKLYGRYESVYEDDGPVTVIKDQLKKLENEDLYSCRYPTEKQTELACEHEAVNNRLKTYIEDITTLEINTVEAMENTTDVLIRQLKAVNKKIGVDWDKIKEYKPNSIYQDGDVYALSYASQLIYEQHESLEDIYEDIWEMEDKLEEMADERETAGIWKTVGGAAMIVTGTVAIIASAGAATPVVVAAVTAGGGTVVFGTADAVEGMQDVYYGEIGDIDSASLNEIKSIVYAAGGDDKTYSLLENVFAFASSAMIPIGTAGKAGELTFRSGIVMLGKEGVSTLAGYGASNLVYDKTNNQTLGMIAGIMASMGTAKGLNMADAKLGWSNKGVKGNVVESVTGDIESGSKSISQVDRIKIDAWDYTPDDELYLKYKDVFDNPKYYNQETGAINWPENNGFADIPMDEVLQPGARIDRYGSDYGSFTSPEGTPYEMRAVAPGTDQRPYSVFEVVEPINVKSGSIASWFDEPGGGIQ